MPYPPRSVRLRSCAAAAAALFALACPRKPAPISPSAPWETPETAAYVGRKACTPCHADAETAWRTSHHDMAMAETTPETVSGDFGNASFTYHGVTSTFTRKDGAYRVRTDGADGALHDYEVAWTFGVFPLQQYLIRFPKGRVQALNVVWDARPKTEGGQRWFHLYPDENVTHSDVLHWTGPYQNWNFMCADCHSTDVKKGYDAASDSYATTFSEIDVSCEACHGPGSAHVAWGEAVRKGAVPKDSWKNGVLAGRKDRDGGRWVLPPGGAQARRSPPRSDRTGVEDCARCHARRSVVAEGYVPGRPLADFYRVQLLEETLYFPDGQIKDEVYEYASFLQSRMYANGVVCADCHDPHTAKLRAAGDAVCGRCHAADAYASPKHHFHKPSSKGASCIGCHMPTRNYMVVHARHDHSIRVPRPDLSAKLGTPNACDPCHAKKGLAWQAAALSKWWPRRVRMRHAGDVIHGGREGLLGARASLAFLVGDREESAPMRATAASLLAGYRGADATRALDAALADTDPLVRMGAVAGVRTRPPEERLTKLLPLLGDTVRAVRIDAARALATVPASRMTREQAEILRGGLAAWRASQLVDADRPEAHLSLGALAAETGDTATAEAEYRIALALAPGFPAASVNLADLYRQVGRDADCEAVLKEGLARTPRSADLHYALGLLRVRQKRLGEACDELKSAATLRPESAHYAFVRGVALKAAGREAESRAVLERALARHTGDAEILSALASSAVERGDRKAALVYAKWLVDVLPDDPEARKLLDALQTR